MRVEGAFIFGFDTDSPDVFDLTLDVIQDWELDSTDISILTPLPGTPLFNQLEKEKRITIRDWSKYDTEHVVFEPKLMTSEDLLNGFQNFWLEINSFQNFLKTGIGALRLGLYPFVANVFSNYYDYRKGKRF